MSDNEERLARIAANPAISRKIAQILDLRRELNAMMSILRDGYNDASLPVAIWAALELPDTRSGTQAEAVQSLVDQLQDRIDRRRRSEQREAEEEAQRKRAALRLVEPAIEGAE
jgi:hypothetical protein